MMRLAWLLVLLVTPRTDAETVYKALDAGDVETLKKFAPAKLVEIVRAGRPVNGSETGELRWTIVDAHERETGLYVIVPAGYDKSKPAGVMLVLHGLRGDGKQLKDNLYKKFASDHNLIIAAPTAQKEPKDNENEDWDKISGSQMPHWWSYKPGNFPLTALSELKKKYAIDENRVILTGYSMGGFGTWNIGLRYPDRFAAIVPFAGGISRREYLAPKKGDPKMRGLVENAFNLPVYFVHGNADDVVPVGFDRKTRDQLKEFGYAHEYVEVDKARHIMDVREGGEIMSKVQEWLAPKKRDAHPKKVVHYAIGAYAASSYWLRIDEISGAEGTARVEAELKDGNVVELKAAGARKVTVFLDEKHVDLAKPVKVTCGGRELFAGPAVESVEAVLESWKQREDRELVYRAKVTVTIP
jgi:predicted esterase